MIEFTNDEILRIKGMANYWKEVRKRDDTSPLDTEIQIIYTMLGADRMLACVESAVAGAVNGGG